MQDTTMNALRPPCLMLLLITFSAALVGCPPSSPGDITNPIAEDLSFVADDDLVYVHHQGGLDQIRVNGTDAQEVYASGYSYQDVAPDLSFWVLGDSETNLYLLDAPGQAPQRIAELNGRASAVAIRPDSGLIAATRHADFDLPQSQYRDDDAIYLIEPSTLEVTILPATSDEWLFQLFWSKDGTKLYGAGHDHTYRIDPATNARERIEVIPHDDIVRRPLTRDTCEVNGERLISDDEGIDLLYPDGTTEDLVTIQGRERGFHDYQSTVSSVSFTRSCDYAVFTFDGSVWVVEVATKIVGKLREGSTVRVFEPIPFAQD